MPQTNVYVVSHAHTLTRADQECLSKWNNTFICPGEGGGGLRLNLDNFHFVNLVNLNFKWGLDHPASLWICALVTFSKGNRPQ